MADLIGAVWLSRPDTLEPVMFGPGDDIPDWALDKMGDHCFVNGERPKVKKAKKDKQEPSGSGGSDLGGGSTSSAYDDKSAAELKKIVDERNDGRDDAWKISKGGAKADLVSRLVLDDHLLAGEYDAVNVDDLKAEIDKRNDGRDDDAKIATGGNKADLVSVLQADDDSQD